MATAQENENQIIDFWKKNKVYEKSKKRNSKGKKFYMMDGPPYATGHIHMGTALNKILKDVAMRSRRLQGFDVFDRPGYDTHGVPIEFQVEKEIGSRGKQDIEKFGVDKFVAKCKDYATKHIDVMNEEFANLGVWMDWENPYITLNDDYIEAIWHAFKEADKKDLLYLGKYPVHVCTRCETAVAFNEIEYGKQKDNAIYVKFPLKKKKDTYLIIWTTTPWTLPANTGVMVHPEIHYQEIETAEGERWIIAKDLVPKIMGKTERGFTEKANFKGKDMEGWEYENPLAKNLRLKVNKGYKVMLSPRYVTTDDGSGLVHCAPGHGKEDYEVGKEYDIDMPSPVSVNGFLTGETGKYSGKKAREVDKEIIEDLEKDNRIVYKHEYEHDYPLCWRDKSPLLMISLPQWFFKISGIQKKLLKENEDVNWVPRWTQSRMKGWLESISDWPVSRQRYWGTPLPIWVDEKSGDKIVVGSVAELQKLSGIKKLDLHKPGIDKIVIKKGGKVYRRVPEVLDVWFDSGVSSWAALGFPGDKKKLKKFWPADLNIEGKDQIRGWWNSQIILSEIAFGKKPFDNILLHGMVLDIGKKKMSKSLGNVISPDDIVKKYSRDHLRYYFAKTSKGEDFSFDEKEFADIQKLFMMINNINTFVEQLPKGKKKICIEDKWIISKFHSLIRDVTESYNNYKFPEVSQKLEAFIVGDLSRTYIKMIRDRSDEVSETFEEIRTGLIQLLAPICPFITEKMWQDLKSKGSVKEESIWFSTLPEAEKKKIDAELEAEFTKVLKIIELGLFKRDQAKIGIRWPLQKITITSKDKLPVKKFEDVIKSQLNIKEIEVKTSKNSEMEVDLDTTSTPELEAEGFAREISRKVQAARKNAGLKKDDMIDAVIQVDLELQKMLKDQIDYLKERINAKKLSLEVLGKDFSGHKHVSEEKIKERAIKISFSVK